MQIKKYRTSKTVALSVFVIAAFGWAFVLVPDLLALKVDFLDLFLMIVLLYGFFDLTWGTYVTLDSEFVARIDSFFIIRRIPIANIEAVRYQPTYGIGKEASSLYVFIKGKPAAAFTMTNVWFGEKQLSQFANDLKKTKPQTMFDDEATDLMRKSA
jgi:hypothetical protein